MEETGQPRSLKLTIKMKGNKIVNNSSAANTANNVAGEFSSSATLTPCSPMNSSQDQVKISSPDTVANNMTENDENQAHDNSQNQLVLYVPPANGGQNEIEPVPISFHRPPKILPSVGAFTVQCAVCFKWRLIPTLEKYEEIREHIITQPFSCETAREWRPTISCEDDPDIVQDGSRLWAIDKPSIKKPPRGWQRILRIRAEGGSKFADVYYESPAPAKKRLRSMVEVMKHLTENKEFEGLSPEQFSFQIPRPLQENYVRKRPSRAPADDANNHGPLLPTQVEPIAWASPDVDRDGNDHGFLLPNQVEPIARASPGVDTDSQLTEAEIFKPEVQSAKRRRPSSPENVVSVEDFDIVNLEDID